MVTTNSFAGGDDRKQHGSLLEKRPFTTEEAARIQSVLDTPIENEYIQFRPSAQGSVAYVEGWKALSLANEVFGFNGWSSEILSLTVDFVDQVDGKFSIGVSCMVRIYLRDGTFHEVDPIPKPNHIITRSSSHSPHRILAMDPQKIRKARLVFMKRPERKL